MYEPDWSDVIAPTYDPVVELGVSQEDYDLCVEIGRELELTEKEVRSDLQKSNELGFDEFLIWWLDASGQDGTTDFGDDECAYVEAIRDATK